MRTYAYASSFLISQETQTEPVWVDKGRGSLRKVRRGIRFRLKGGLPEGEETHHEIGAFPSEPCPHLGVRDRRRLFA